MHVLCTNMRGNSIVTRKTAGIAAYSLLLYYRLDLQNIEYATFSEF